MAGLIVMFIFGVVAGVAMAAGWHMFSQLEKKANSGDQS